MKEKIKLIPIAFPTSKEDFKNNLYIDKQEVKLEDNQFEIVIQ